MFLKKNGATGADRSHLLATLFYFFESAYVLFRKDYRNVNNSTNNKKYDV